MHGKFKTRKNTNLPRIHNTESWYNVKTLLYVLNECEIVQPKLKVLKELRDRTECSINDSQSDIVEELIHVQTDVIMLNEGACESGQSDQIFNNSQNQK